MESIPPVPSEGRGDQEMLASQEGEPRTDVPDVIHKHTHKRTPLRTLRPRAGRLPKDPYAKRRRRAKGEDYPPSKTRPDLLELYEDSRRVRLVEWLQELPMEPLTPNGLSILGPTVLQLAQWFVGTMADIWQHEAPESTVHEHTQEDAINPDSHCLGQRDPLNMVAYLTGDIDTTEFHRRILRCNTSVIDKIPALSGGRDSCPQMVEWLGMMDSILFKMLKEYRQTLDVIVDWDILETEFRKLSTAQQIAAVARAHMRLPMFLRCHNRPPNFPGQPAWGSLNRYLEVTVVRLTGVATLKITCFPFVLGNDNDVGDELRKLADSCIELDKAPGRNCVDLEVSVEQTNPVEPEGSQSSRGTRHWSYRPIDATDLQATGPLLINTWYPINMQEIYELVTLWDVLGILLIPTVQTDKLHLKCRLGGVIDFPLPHNKAFPGRSGRHIDVVDDDNESFIFKVLRRGFAPGAISCPPSPPQSPLEIPNQRVPD
ncbi:hypothetical protein GGR58DRAFT_527456 [Xylaria digitata]|nr:hypothetical protein GGR58DRAFT_527456 [Xylaria digitata]